MDKNRRRGLIIGVVVLVFVANISLGLFLQQRSRQHKVRLDTSTQSIAAQQIIYKGVAGKDALTLLEVEYPVEQDKSGLVTLINRRKTQGAKHEYWAFYVNGKMSQVGPQQYITKDTDTIMWKIDNY